MSKEKAQAARSFEEETAELDRILERLERGDLSLDASLSEYERGVASLRRSRAILAAAELKLQELSPAPEDAS